MQRILGIGGHFLRATDPTALFAWYRDTLGLDVDEDGVWHQEPGPTVLAMFPADTDYFGRQDQQVMLNLRVDDLDAMLMRLRSEGAHVSSEVTVMDGVGHFGWVVDPEGHRIELWQPDAEPPSG